ncbi:YdcF family protein [Fulvivirgaceae bacterium BMA10]|uniref:YdcF family protein n=1 Tax=Splendidivirga corallicola TaxID=3051826 RepID=A0ABT8KPF9_9BACT|nr:YdcF family protein [Fulvivirgaceae bacterium BMA10]
MFFILSKTVYFLAMPLTIIVACFLLSYFFRNILLKKRLFLLGTLLLLLFTNDFIINEFLLIWEESPTTINQVKNDYDIGIVLTGITNVNKKPHDRVHFNKGADRILHALQLYREGKIKRILISGGSGSLLRKDFTEAQGLQSTLLMAGVNPEDIILESNSRNTFENAKFSTELIKQKFQNQKCLLITSAFHMRRSRACFAKTGLPVDTFSVDFYTHDRMFTPDILILPQVGALSKWNILIREILGVLTYRIMGYI